MNVFEAVKNWVNTNLSDLWLWFSTLSQHEWMVVLGIVAAGGFLCMKNFNHRGTL